MNERSPVTKVESSSSFWAHLVISFPFLFPPVPLSFPTSFPYHVSFLPLLTPFVPSGGRGEGTVREG